MDIKHSMYYLNITIHTPSYIGVVIKIPVKVIVEIINKTDNYTLIKLSLRFTHTRYLDIIPKEATLYNPSYVLLNNRTFSINESAEWIHNLTYVIKLLNYNNNAYIDNTSMGFFSFYINTPINAREIEKLVDRGLLEFTPNGFKGRILEYMGKPLYLTYNGPNLPLEIRSSQYLRFKIFDDWYYVYEPEPLYYVNYKGVIIPVPGIREAYIYPFKYNASQIMTHIHGFKLTKYGFLSSTDQEITIATINVEYLYKYPISATVVFPLYHRELFNASFILFHDLRLIELNMTQIQGYRVGYIDEKYLTIHSETDLKLIIDVIIIAVIMAFTGYRIWQRKHY